MATTVVNKKYQEYDVYIGRGSKWGNPFRIGPDGSREMVIKKYEEWIRTQEHLLKDLTELKDQRLGCYCYPLWCHGDILARMAEELDQD